MERLAQVAVCGVLQHRQQGMRSVSFQPDLPSATAASAAAAITSAGTPASKAASSMDSA